MIDINEYLNNFFKGTKNPSLKAMQFFMKEYEFFEKEMKFIHVAGTNGKGSTVEMMTNILRCEGYSVGKFISPHLVRYNERISVNGVDISDEELEALIIELEPFINQYNQENETKITLFELETTMALLYFYRKKVDFVVLETGLGGLYDCTNVITKPFVSIITSIGYDHVQILGNTLPEIAYQKAGIIKENSHTIFVEQSEDVNEVIQKECEKKSNELHLIQKEDMKNYRYDDTFQTFDYKTYQHLQVNLKGMKQISNASICVECFEILNQLGYKISEDSLRQGLKTVIHKARMEVLNEHPLIIYDGAHNEPAIQNLQKSVEMYYGEKKRVYVVSILKTKDYKKIIELLLEDTEAEFIFTSGSMAGDYVPADELYQVASQYRKDGIVTSTLEKAIEKIFEEKKDTIYFMVGSFYIYGDVVNKIKEIKSKIG